jgi:hypothetical protein
MQSAGRLLKSRRAWLFLLLGALAAALSGMFCGLTQRGLQFERVKLAQWQGTSSKSEWPGPVPPGWSRLLATAPNKVTHTQTIEAGWTFVSMGKYWTHPDSTHMSYVVHAWGFPIPSMRHDDANDLHIAVDRFGYYNAVDQLIYGGLAVEGSFAGMLPVAIVPILPWWPGFVLNTLFWAISLAWITSTLRKARCFTRLERGQCVKCKYQMGVLPACPECGYPSPIQLANLQAKP